MITRKSTIDQHRGTHPSGAPIYELHEVVTEFDLDEYDLDEQAWVDDVHDAHVELESLPSDLRERARQWMADHEGDGADDADKYRDAIAAARRSRVVTAPTTLDRITALLRAFEDLGVPFAQLFDHGARKALTIQTETEAAAREMASAIGAPPHVRRHTDDMHWIQTDAEIGTMRISISSTRAPIRTEIHEISDEIARLTGGGR